ncbi:MAG: heat-inducible transcriptional repressor HrcA [Scytolyngbya sp. HA4215-MV1]|jgi:heat-inducible transcriptional repressor|nr:heat-inducible transcriptional repressor HrcA [Scytolyngbya sp. HA4215-MV1]
MAVFMNLTHRQQHILWATIRHYITTAEPVGSKALVEEYNLNVSPATIRNAMSFLEKAGLLYQPHTSAGRIPSDSGYRIYVDQLITPSNEMAHEVDQLLNGRLGWDSWSLEALLRGAAQILATVSGYIALITMPQPRAAFIRHVQLVQVDPGRIMLIVVTDNYETQSVLMELPQPDAAVPLDTELFDRELKILSNFLSEHLNTRSLSDLSTLDWGELGRDFEHYAACLKTVQSELAKRFQVPTSTHIFISGVSEVLRRQPEFSELHQVQAILHLLEEGQDQLLPLIFEDADPDPLARRVNVRIGSENPLETIRTCTLISSTYSKGTVPVGSVGVLGPTRMVYENAIAVVAAAADYLSEAIG